MNEFYTEINAYRKPNESNRKFAGRLGVHPSMLRYWENGMIPKEETIIKMAKALGIDKKIQSEWVEWAQRMAGEDMKSSQPLAKLRVVRNSVSHPIMQENQNGDFIHIPCVEPILDGEKLRLSSKDAWFKFRKDWICSIGSDESNMFLKIVWEKDMEPDLQPGDVVLVDIGKIGLRNDGIYAVQSDGFIILRRLTLLRGGRVRISSDANRSDSVEGVPGEDVHIIGQVVWMGRIL